MPSNKLSRRDDCMHNLSSAAIWKVIISAMAILFVGETLWCLLPFPYWDSIDWILSYLRDGAAAVFAPHNEHRVPFPRLLVGLDIDMFGGLLWPVSLVALVAPFVLAAVIGRATITLSKHSDPAGVATGCALVASLLLRGYTIPDYITPANVQFPIRLVFSALTLAALVSRPGWPMVAVAMVLALTATGCGAGGLAVLPVLAWLAWRLHGHIAAVLMFGAATVLVPMLYVRGMSIATPADLGWMRLPLFLIEYFGVPWTRLPATLPLAWAQGGMIVVALAICILRKLSRGSITSSSAFLLGLAATVLGIASMDGLGRASMVDLQTQGSRYGVIAATAQVVFIALLWPRIWTHVRNWSHRWCVCVFAEAIGLLFAEQVVSGFIVHRRTVEFANAAHRLCGGSTAPSDLTKIYPLPDRALDFMHEIERRKLYCFRPTAMERS